MQFHNERLAKCTLHKMQHYSSVHLRDWVQCWFTAHKAMALFSPVLFAKCTKYNFTVHCIKGVDALAGAAQAHCSYSNCTIYLLVHFCAVGALQFVAAGLAVLSELVCCVRVCNMYIVELLHNMCSLLGEGVCAEKEEKAADSITMRCTPLSIQFTD